MSTDDYDIEKTLSGAIANVLRHEIIAGKWKANEKLKTERLKERFSVSSATVRDALFVLMSEYLVTLEGQKGFRVAPMSLADAQELAKTRAVVEAAALEESLQAGDDKWEALITAEYYLLAKAEERMRCDPISSIDEYEKTNDRFHEALVSASSSERMKKMRRMFFQEAKRYRRMVALSSEVVIIHDKEEHEKIFNACIQRNVGLAKSLIADHVQSSIRGLTKDCFKDKPSTAEIIKLRGTAA